MNTIIIVEDDDNIRELVKYALKSADFCVIGCENAEQMRSEIAKHLPDLILLDIMLPEEDGIEILKRLKSGSKTADVPVIMLTAKGSEFDRVKGLDLGADDYISKPFSVLELISRIRAVLRRCKGDQSETITVGILTMDISRRMINVNGTDIVLTYKEFELLYQLMKNEGLVLSREKLMEKVWGYDFQGESRTLDVHIKSLRQKIGDAGEMIATIRGVGYKMQVDMEKRDE